MHAYISGLARKLSPTPGGPVSSTAAVSAQNKFFLLTIFYPTETPPPPPSRVKCLIPPAALREKGLRTGKRPRKKESLDRESAEPRNYTVLNKQEA